MNTISSLVPDWNHPEKGKKYREALRKYAMDEGFSSKEVTEFGKDPRIVLLVFKALIFDKTQAQGDT